MSNTRRSQSNDQPVSSSMAAAAAAASADTSASMPSTDMMQIDSIEQGADHIDALVQDDSPLSRFEGNAPEVFTTELSRFFSTSDKAHLAKTCRQFNTLFKPELNQLAIDKLLTHIIRGEQAEAEKMIRSNPLLLLETGIVEDYSGRKIEGTALQMALGAEDVKYHDDEECMVEMIHKYLRQLPNGEAIIAEQTAKQFPEGWEFKEEQRAMRDSDVLYAVINTIANSENPAEWKKVIQTLKTYLEFENKSKLIQTGKHFNHQLLVAALDSYNQNYDRFGGFDSAKSNTVWRKVLGTVERYVPAATAQALCMGVGNILDKTDKLQRKLTLYNFHSGREISYFPLDVDSGSFLGRDFAVFSCYGVIGVLVGIRMGDEGRLQKLCQIKTSNLQRLCSADSLSRSAQRPGV